MNQSIAIYIPITALDRWSLNFGDFHGQSKWQFPFPLMHLQ